MKLALFTLFAALTLTASAQAKVVKQANAINNPDFKIVADVPADKQKYCETKQFLKGWSIYGGKLVQKDGKNMIELKDYMYTLMPLWVSRKELGDPKAEKSLKLTGKIKVSGKGKLKVYLSGCIRKPGDKRGFGNELKPQLRLIDLTEKAAEYPLEVTIEPYSSYYLEFRKQGGGTALIESVSLKAEIAPAKK